jgi:hypothetical protein
MGFHVAIELHGFMILSAHFMVVVAGGLLILLDSESDVFGEMGLCLRLITFKRTISEQKEINLKKTS